MKQVTPHASPAHVTFPAHDLMPEHSMVLASASVVTPWAHDEAPEQLTVQLPLVHVTGPVQALVPHFTSQLEPPQVTAAQELAALQSMAHALAALQSMAPQPLAWHVTAQGIPGGQVTPPRQLPAEEHSKTQVPASLHEPPPPHRSAQVAASGPAGPESTSGPPSPRAASSSRAEPSGLALAPASRSAPGGVPSSVAASLASSASPPWTRYGGS